MSRYVSWLEQDGDAPRPGSLMLSVYATVYMSMGKVQVDQTSHAFVEGSRVAVQDRGWATPQRNAGLPTSLRDFHKVHRTLLWFQTVLFSVYYKIRTGSPALLDSLRLH